MEFSGEVIRGDRKGTALGYPTVNIEYDKSVTGVFAAHVYIEDEAPYAAAAFADPSRGVLEAHLLDFSDDLYGLAVTIELYVQIRESKKFDDEATLKAAIADDVAKVREYFRNKNI